VRDKVCEGRRDSEREARDRKRTEATFPNPKGRRQLLKPLLLVLLLPASLTLSGETVERTATGEFSEIVNADFPSSPKKDKGRVRTPAIFVHQIPRRAGAETLDLSRPPFSRRPPSRFLSLNARPSYSTRNPLLPRQRQPHHPISSTNQLTPLSFPTRSAHVSLALSLPRTSLFPPFRTSESR